MEQVLNDNVYVIDLGDINTAPEIIFELSSVLDKEEVKNKRICLKLGNVDLNQAQLLSIKSLISGIDSILSSIDTKSVETEKVALSLGIIISNVSAENTYEISPAMPYKTAEELKEEIQANNNENKEDVIVEEPDLISQNETSNTIISEEAQNLEKTIDETAKQEEEIIEEKKEDTVTTENSNIQNPVNEELQDELDVIFGSNPVQTSIFDMEPSQEETYAEREELTDIIVPEQEYTKEDIELEAFPTKYIKQTIRSGQVINYEGNIVIIGDCHPGCEVTALGDITVWGVLSGIAHAGAGGNQKARVRALKMNAIQLRIANCYSRRPDSLNTVFIEKTNSFTPEEARIINGEIVVFKIND
ncbi:MAG: hypothetical protein LUH05_07935 [Candidatus Gastranaerophilales bacterium]|nr:hypothetical protein [Candidatus Gastranaerophilales bacterium]